MRYCSLYVSLLLLFFRDLRLSTAKPKPTTSNLCLEVMQHARSRWPVMAVHVILYNIFTWYFHWYLSYFRPRLALEAFSIPRPRSLLLASSCPIATVTTPQLRPSFKLSPNAHSLQATSNLTGTSEEGTCSPRHLPHLPPRARSSMEIVTTLSVASRSPTKQALTIDHWQGDVW